MIIKTLNFLRSMKFGMLLLILILICSFIGSIVPQGNDAINYATEYPQFSDTILLLGLNNIFKSWYFITLLCLLCINLVFCSILRLKNTVRNANQGFNKAATLICEPIEHKYAKITMKFIKSQRFKTYNTDSSTIYYKNISGYYGSFLVHLSLLLILIFGACSTYYASTEDINIIVGESATLSDGTVITVEAFRIEDENGETDYESILLVTDKHGNNSKPTAVKVNYPFSFGGHKYYQQTYGLAGYITVINKGISNPLYMTDSAFITADGNNGIMYYAVYPDYIKNEDGSVSVLKDHGKDSSNPIYMIATIEDNETIDGMALPGTSFQIGDMICTFNNPGWYPGIRVKTDIPLFMGLLYTSFALMIAGLWLCFFHVPVYIKFDQTGYAIYSPKPIYSIKTQIKAAIETCEREVSKC